MPKWIIKHWYLYNRILVRYKKESSTVVCYMYEPQKLCAK